MAIDFTGKKIKEPEDITIDERLDMIPTDSRAKQLEEHYGKTIDLGFRFSF